MNPEDLLTFKNKTSNLINKAEKLLTQLYDNEFSTADQIIQVEKQLTHLHKIYNETIN